ncbi:DPP IV N-terminal domain-containing protein [Kitasatospora purpeofusca]|uniref:DPP IV N-terminal domain-containing protein n=1 Tax=Kitasatospora purpeofusca TaxID=67352 RepID=UPI00224E4780|nr:DPP IV N-terminal domain-containing protein [Kitasatospora purpeofusca]MCX4682990.1 DPP IV N-terminal domain-containing protein [Kitasatospora purpeofusca]
MDRRRRAVLVRGGQGGGRRFVLVDPAAGTREPAFDHARLAAALAAASGRPVDPEALPLTAVRPTGGAVEFAALGRYWRCRLDDYTCEPAGFTPPGSPLEVPSPDGKVTVTRRGPDLWARSLSDGRRWALTTDGTPDHPERDGRGHLYRYDLHTGALLGQVTSGPWSVRQILRVDEARRVVYFTAAGRVEEDPYRRTVCRAALDGPRFGSGSGFGFSFGFGFGLGSGFGSSSGFGFAELTDDELDHAVTVADGQEYFLDSASTVDTPPATRVRDWTGRVLVELSA